MRFIFINAITIQQPNNTRPSHHPFIVTSHQRYNSLGVLYSRWKFLTDQLEIADSLIAKASPPHYESVTTAAHGQAQQQNPPNANANLRGGGAFVPADHGEDEREHGNPSTEDQDTQPHRGAAELMPIRGGEDGATAVAAAGFGVHVAGHFILGRSQEEFGSTTVDEVRLLPLNSLNCAYRCG